MLRALADRYIGGLKGSDRAIGILLMLYGIMRVAEVLVANRTAVMKLLRHAHNSGNSARSTPAIQSAV